jgi:hypothetical protein
VGSWQSCFEGALEEKKFDGHGHVTEAGRGPGDASLPPRVNSAAALADGNRFLVAAYT